MDNLHFVTYMCVVCVLGILLLRVNDLEEQQKIQRQHCDKFFTRDEFVELLNDEARLEIQGETQLEIQEE